MPKVAPLQNNFGSGEISPITKARNDIDRYKLGMERCLNYIPIIQGGLTKRSGTKFVAEIKDSSKQARLVGFEFSVTQAYILEFGNLYIRFYKNNGQITLTGQSITGITNANPGVLTYSGSDTYANGDEVYISGITGAIGTYLNGRNFKVANVNTGANTFELNYLDGTAVNTTSMGAYGSTGTIAEVYTITSTYLEADIPALKFTQSADVLYITHPSYQTRTLTRSSHTSWTLSLFTNLDGPYLPINTTATTITPSGTAGAGVTLTASAALFASTDVGRLVRILHSTTWGWGTITAYTSATVVTATITGAFAATTASADWRLGVWSDTTGYPAAVCFHEDRLFFGGNTSTPQRLDASKTGDYTNFSPTNSTGVVADDNGLSFTLNSNDVNVVRWLTSDEKGLLVGTVGGEWVVSPSSQGEALSPTNVKAKKSTSYGCKNIQGLQAGKSTLFVQRAGKKLREMAFFYDVDGFKAPDLTVLSEHIAQEGFVYLAYQKEPQGIVWGVRSDGVLLGVTYERDLDTLRAGWHRHILGGFSDAADTHALVESISVIPSADGTRDELWLIVKRYINGATKRYVEYLSEFFNDSMIQREAYFTDGGLTYDNPLTVTGISQAAQAVVTSASHGLSNGDYVWVSDVLGMDEVNDTKFLVSDVATNTFKIKTTAGVYVSSVGYSPYVSGGYVRKYVSTISGLWHLEGESVSVCADGGEQTNQTVTTGQVTLQYSASTIHLGYHSDSEGMLLPFEAGAANGTALGKTKRTHRIGVWFHRSLDLKIGFDFDDLSPLVFRGMSDPMDSPPPLFSGIKSHAINSGYDFYNQICFRQDKPLPSTILAIAPQMDTQDR